MAEAGCAIIGQTAELAPADKRFYGIRDVTATVESVPLITASILSKKLAAGLDALVMDVKTGTGAFAAEMSMAQELARSIATVASGAGTPTTALITDMNQVLGSHVGNALEVAEAADYLTGKRRDRRLHEVTIALAAEMLVLGGLAGNPESGASKAEAALYSGKAAEKFGAMVAALGGPADFLDNPSAHLTTAPVALPVDPAGTGTVNAMDTRAIGVAVVELGGGRTKAADPVDHRVGLTDVAAIGDEVGPERPLAVVHAADAASAERAAQAVRQAMTLGENGYAGPVVMERIAGS